MKMLPVFPQFQPSNWTLDGKRAALQSPQVKKVVSFALGPAGTNIAQAAAEWHLAVGIGGKSEIVLCDLPETALQKTLELNEPGVLGVFWTCAVFKRLHQIFFDHPETFPFFFQHDMLLDEMQLAVFDENLGRHIADGVCLDTITIASHVSPAPLLSGLVHEGAKVVDASSNTEASRMCAAGEVSACITTESGRMIHGLRKVHSFGSPLMIFFGGISMKGMRLLEGWRGSSNML